MTAMISAMTAMVRVFMRTFPSRMWALLATPDVASIIPRCRTGPRTSGSRPLSPGFLQGGAPLPPGRDEVEITQLTLSAPKV